MGLYGTILRIAISVLTVPGILFVYVVLADSVPFRIGPLLWTALISGLMVGLVGSAIESYLAYHQSFARRFLYWTVVTALIVYFTGWFVSIWPITFFGALIMGGVVGLVQMVITPKYAGR